MVTDSPTPPGTACSYRQYSPLGVSPGGEFSEPSADRTAEALISLHAWMPARDASAGSGELAALVFPAFAWLAWLALAVPAAAMAPTG